MTIAEGESKFLSHVFINHVYVVGAWSVWDNDMDPTWRLHYSRWRHREQCGLICKEIHHRKLFSAWRNSSRRLHHLHPETGLCWGSMLCHTHAGLPGSVDLMQCVLFSVPLHLSRTSTHACMLCVTVGMSWCGGERALFPSVPVRGLWMCSREGVSLYRHHCLRPTLRSGRCFCTLA